MFKQKKIFLVVLLVIGLIVVAWKTGFLGKNLELLSKRSSPAPLEELLQTAPTPPNTATFISPLKDARITLIAKILASTDSVLPKEDRATADFLRFWFYADEEVYAEYAVDGSATANRMIFIVTKGDILTRIALYGAGQNGWELLGGKDILLTKPQKDLYVYNAASKQWMRAN